MLIIFWRVIFRFLPDFIKDWDFKRLIGLNSICYISWGFFTLFWGIHNIPEKVIKGELDKFLARPMSIMVGLIGEGIRLEAVYEIFTGIVSLVMITVYYNIRPSLIDIFLGLSALIIGTTVVILVHGTVSLLSLWIGRMEHFQSVIDGFDDFQKYPLEFFPGKIHFFLLYILPLYFPGAFATKLYFGMKIPVWHYVSLLGVLIFWTLAFSLTYKYSKKKI